MGLDGEAVGEVSCLVAVPADGVSQINGQAEWLARLQVNRRCILELYISSLAHLRCSNKNYI